ncbi:MAG: hypothetical protein ACXWP1_00625 [Bdellovibrionota bacterium]
MVVFLYALLLFMPAQGEAAFDPSLTPQDQTFLRNLLSDLPAVALARDPARLAALETSLENYALSERNNSRAELALTLASTFWSDAINEPKWMVQSSLSMIQGLKAAGRGSSELSGFEAALDRKAALISQTEAGLNTADPANLPKLAAALQTLVKGDGPSPSWYYVKLRSIYVPFHLAPALAGIPLSDRLFKTNLSAWDTTMAHVERQARATAASLPISVQDSFVKSVLDLFFAAKFPLLDMRFAEILDPLHPNGSLSPDPNASETRSALNSLVRVLQLVDLFRDIDRAGGGRAFVRGFQPRVDSIPNLCGRFNQLAAFSETDWQKIRASGKTIVVDPGHLGGEFADDGRDVSPPGEKGQESFGYREGHDTFLIANLAKRLLVQCGDLPEANVLLSRRGLHDEGSQFFDHAGFPLRGQPGPNLKVSDNLYFRKAVLGMVKPDFLISIHTDFSDTLTQHGLIMIPHHPLDLNGTFYKPAAQYAGSLALAETLKKSLGTTMFSGTGTPSGKSANDWLHSEFKEYYLKEMNLQIFRDFERAPTALVEGYDYASSEVRALMNSVVRGHRANDPDVKQMRIDGTPYFYHTVHQSYAEGVALGALRFILANP